MFSEAAFHDSLSADYAAMASKAVLLRITKVEPSRRISSFFFKSLRSRVTVSRDDPIICAISSWVRLDRMRISLAAFSLFHGP